MEILTGHDEKQQIVCNKINAELSILPQIFTQYVLHLRANQKSNTTIQSYLNTLTACLRTIYQDYYITDETFFEKTTHKDIAYYFDAKNTLGVKTLQSHWSVLNSFFSYLVKTGLIAENPMHSIRRPVERDTNRKLNFLNRSELDRLLITIKHSPTKFTAFRDEVMIKLAISTGLDVSDIVNLNFGDIDYANNKICVTNKKGTKLIPIGSSNIALLKKWGAFRQEYFKGNDTPALFVSTKKTRISVDAVGNMLHNYCERANVPDITFKDLKSTMVYLLAKENVSMDSIMNYLGVTDYLMIVQAYDAAMKEYDTNILSAIDELFEAPISSNINEYQQQDLHRNFSLEFRLPEYAEYTKGGEGFTLYGNIYNRTEEPLKLKLKSCALYINGMLRASDYSYSGYQFDEEYILPKTTRTFGKIWITDGFVNKKLSNNDYVTVCLVDTNAQTEHHIKFVFKESELEDFWIQENWYEIDL